MTDAERRIWQMLRSQQIERHQFRRQVPIGRYIADFVCHEARLIIEIDGSQHAESDTDRIRKTELEAKGFRVLRFWNDDVLRDMNAVCDTIIAYVRDTSLQPWR